MTAYDLHDQWDKYRRLGGRSDFVTWAIRLDETYACDAGWLAVDYTDMVRTRDDGIIAPSFRTWLMAQPADYRYTHMGETS